VLTRLDLTVGSGFYSISTLIFKTGGSTTVLFSYYYDCKEFNEIESGVS
jgi:hypothetical protein